MKQINPQYRSSILELCDDALLRNIEVYDHLAGKVEFTFPLDAFALCSAFKPHGCLLDYGCGTGRAFQLLKTCRATEIWGYDASFKMCEYARREHRGLNIKQVLNPRCPGLPAAFFDGVLLSGVLSSIVPLTERMTLVNEIARCMRPGGVLVVGDFGQSNTPTYLSRYRLESIEPHTFLTKESLWIHHFSSDEIVALIANDFQVQSQRTIPVKTIHGNSLSGHIFIARRN